MAITYPLTPPTSPVPDSMVLQPKDVVGMSQSPFTGTQQVHQHQGAWFEAELALPRMTRAQWAPWAAFLTALRGRYGTFWLPAYLTTSPQGAGGGTPIVDGGGQTGSALDISGGPLSTTAWLKAGDFLQVGNELKMALADTDTDGSGDATIDIYPPIRTSPTAGASVTISNPNGLFRLMDNTRKWSAEPNAIFSGITIHAIEAF